MKGKIMVFALMCALMVGVVPLRHSTKAYAATEIANVNEGAFASWCSGNGLPSEIGYALSDAELNRNINYIVFFEPENDNTYYVLRFTCVSDFCKPYFSGREFHINDSSSTYSYSWVRTSRSAWGNCFCVQEFEYYPVLNDSVYYFYDKQIVFSTVDIYTDSSCTELLFESSLREGYSFVNWCSDACIVIDERINVNLDYRYFVTKNSFGYDVIQVYSDDELRQFTEVVSYDNKLYLHEKDDIDNDFYVNRYSCIDGVWENNGKYYYSFSDDEMIDLGVKISANNLLCYSDSTIKTGELFGNVYYEKNTGFTDGFAGEVSPSHNPCPIVTPTPVPSVPAPDNGYNVYVYRPSLNGVISADWGNMCELPSVDSNIVAAFIKTWKVSVQGYCQDKDGVIWYLCSAVRDDITYTGYVQAKHVKVESYNGIDVNIGDVSIDDIPEVIETAKDSVVSALELVSVVPLMMGAVFGFLPSWCLLLVGVSFVFICVIGLIKVFRG